MGCTHQGAYQVILYEYPFNERIRAYLRLEYLFDRLFFFSEKEDLHHHQIAVTTLFDILDALERIDFKTAVLQNIERQRSQLTSLRGHPVVRRAHGLRAWMRAMHTEARELRGDR